DAARRVGAHRVGPPLAYERFTHGAAPPPQPRLTIGADSAAWAVACTLTCVPLTSTDWVVSLPMDTFCLAVSTNSWPPSTVTFVAPSILISPLLAMCTV